MLTHYIKIAFRNLWKYKTQSVISIVGLAVGFTCFALCSYALRVKLDYNKNMKDVDRICLVYSQSVEREGYATFGYRYTADELKKLFPEIESGTAYYWISPDVDKLCESVQEDGTTVYHEERFLFADHSFLDVFNVEIVQGRKEDFLNLPNAILLTETAALRFFGTTDAVGKTFTDIDDFHDRREVFTVQGIIKDFPKRTQFEDLTAIELNTAIIDNPTDWRLNDSYFNFVKLKPNTNLHQLNARLENFLIPHIEGKEWKVQLIPLLEQDALRKDQSYMTILLIFFVVGLLILLTALINYVGFVFGHILNRIRECGIRKVNGAVSRSLFTAFFMEALLSFLAACVISFLLMKFFVPFVSELRYFSSIELDYMYRLLGQYTIGGILLLALICFVSTARLINMPVMQSLRGGFVKYNKVEVRNVFLTVQLIICILFLGASLFLYMQTGYMKQQYGGGLSEEDKARIFSVGMNGDKLNAARSQIESELKQNPDVELVTRTGMDIFNAWELGKGRFSWEGISDEQASSSILNLLIDANYPDLIRTEMKEGRFFTDEEPDNVVVNESFAKFYGSNPIGKQITARVWDVTNTYTVVGILPDIVNTQFKSDVVIQPCLYLPYPEGHINLTYYVRVREGAEEKFRTAMTENLYRFVHESTPVWISNVMERTQSRVNSERELFRLIFPFSIITIIIGLLGMYASVLINTEKRRKEVAVRKINGASTMDIVRLFCRHNFTLVLIAAIVALPLLYYGLTTWLQNYAFRMEISVLPFILLLVIICLLVLFTILGQVLRISRINPAEVMKN